MFRGAKPHLQSLPKLGATASSAAAQRCKISKALGLIRSGDQILLCYTGKRHVYSSNPLRANIALDFGVYVNGQGEIIGHAIDWTIDKVTHVSFGGPYIFLVSEKAIEVRLIDLGRKIEILEGSHIRLVRGADEVRNVPNLQRIKTGTDALMEDIDEGLLHLVLRDPEQDGDVVLMELQVDIMDLSSPT